jgi:hypothetical protein
LPFILAGVLALGVAAAGADGSKGGRASRHARALASNRHSELAAAVGLLRRFNPALLQPNRAVSIHGRSVRPAFTALRYDADRVASISHLTGSLVRGEVSGDDLAFYLARSAPPDFALPSTGGAKALIGDAALVGASIQRQTDALLRPTPLGISAYFQIRSAGAPERIVLESNISCAPIGFEVIERTAKATFAVEGPTEYGGAECEQFSRERVPQRSAVAASDTAASYREELRVIATARRAAAKHHAGVIAVVRAAPAHDAAGRVVPTDVSWRFEGPVLRVHHRMSGVRYPVIARIDFLTVPRSGG